MGDQTDLVTSIGDSLTKLDQQLMSGDPPFQSAQWQQLYAMRKHLDDQQRDLVQQTFQDDDAQFKTLAADVQTATKDLNHEIATTKRVDTIITIVSQISADVDQILKLA